MKYFNTFILLLIIVLSSCTAPAGEITLLHWNDFHSRNLPWVPTSYNPGNHSVGGYALFDAYLDSLQREYPGALRVHAGDDFQGSPVCAVTKGVSQIKILNLVKPDFFTIGNHEFDYGWHHVDSLRRHLAEFEMYAANLVDAESGESALPQYKIFRINRYPVVLIGLTHPQLDFLTMAKNLEGIQVADPVSSIQDLIDNLKKRGLHTFVVVSHMGIDLDRELAKTVPEIDLIVGGHSHTYMREAENVNGVWIVQADDSGRYVGVTRFKAEKGNIVSLEMQYIETIAGKLRPSPDVEALIMRYEDAMTEIMDEEIAYLQTAWTRSGGESNIGNWITDAFRATVPGTDIAIMNNGGIRKDLPSGTLRVRDVWEIAPFGNMLVCFEWSGRELQQALHNMALKNRSLQFSGIHLLLDRSKGLIEAEINGSKIDPEKTYSIITNDYTAGQAPNYFGMEIPAYQELGLVDRDVLVEAARKQKTIHVQIEGRIRYR
ncbi:MAG: bifunctional UDP-sugar hydrolase/5'-nucleotidase [Candidatus Marinimicrobia bacterium]|jgi:5'-nucleotidase|nr:bifunctional UDP-sugar hydrolase/5'-nucleotidase [Candidatus Neomarinimicrobiota bacterium]MDD3716961.1 bifunctional UDP-sugar hydrolase/5'-nucleotidase [Candidatus Neomarinimicrobiota bacterium]MDD5710203.1 bifunctional UDP-sugar hydrolase/5'-nucleotidase [Candidatus Neomarinimicrobiota bacterium]MDX9778054.1 bifunctional UDP-sugar hydrolase/5'-nucleotidase [bacterium]